MEASTARGFDSPATLARAQALVVSARARFGAAACSLALVEDDHLHYVLADGAGAAEIVGTSLSIDRGLAGWVVQTGQAVLVGDVEADRRFARDVAEQTHYVPRTLLLAPVLTDDGPLGVLTVLDRDAERPDAADDLDTVAEFAARLGELVGSSKMAPTPAASDDDDWVELVARVTRLKAVDRERAAAVLRELLAAAEPDPDASA